MSPVQPYSSGAADNCEYDAGNNQRFLLQHDGRWSEQHRQKRSRNHCENQHALFYHVNTFDVLLDQCKHIITQTKYWLNRLCEDCLCCLCNFCCQWIQKGNKVKATDLWPCGKIWNIISVILQYSNNLLWSELTVHPKATCFKLQFEYRSMLDCLQVPQQRWL